MLTLRSRVDKLEATTGPERDGVFQIILKGPPTPEQSRQIAEAEAQNKLVIIRTIVSPNQQN